MSQSQSVDPDSIIETPIIDKLSSESLTQSAVKGFSWNLAGSFVRHGAGFLINIILARLLGPEPFGIVAIATIVISIGNLIVDSGLNASLVQKNELTEGDIKYVFTIQMVLGISIYLLIVLLTPLISRWFAETEIIPVLRVLSLMIVLQAASQTSMGLLKRNLKFKQIQQAVLVSYLVGYLLLGLPLAYAGKGVWSLVFAQLTQSLIFLIMVYWNARHPIAFSFQDENKVTRFGVNILGLNIANWTINHIDSASIGKWFGSEMLGLYNRSMGLIYMPVNILVDSIKNVIFPATSRAQNSVPKIKAAFLGVFSLFAFIFFPLSIYVNHTADKLILAIYGVKWVGAIPMLQIIALTIPFNALMAIEGPVLMGLGMPEIELKKQSIVATIAIIAFIIAAQFSLMTLLWTVFLIYVIRLILMTLPIIYHLNIKFQEFFELVIISGILTIFILITNLVFKNLLTSYPLFIYILILSGVNLIVWVAVLASITLFYKRSRIISNIIYVSTEILKKTSNHI